MKKIALSVTAALLLTSFFSCKKETGKPPAVIPVQQGAVEQLIKEADPTAASDGQTYELGVAFKSAVKGNIQTLKLHLPQSGEYRVTLWKVTDQSIIAGNQLACTHADGWKDSLVVNIPIDANTPYILSVNTKVFYYFNGSSTTFPFTKGDITLTGYAGKISREQLFPDLPLSQTPAGFVDFTFQPMQ
ncbi:DUF4082 domain-containing protein [Ferruginibacter paludis]|uniref:DUF4082 domain-containing protein n=1 Tax=Ferruginibacter paludis TaxID=1310417 RepID=UPI0025B5EEE1|nr:DUF4082 domain-containing protein [Ferruginibacter paludis]MDN3659189.1 DUF4082 domain-containing protein [Ferruginibacter paludis]